MSTRKQCELLGVNRSVYYYIPVPIDEETVTVMNILDEEYTKRPFYGVRRMLDVLEKRGYDIGKDRVRSLLREMGLMAIYPKKYTSISNKEHKKYPYLLNDLAITGRDQVWAADITYVRLSRGYAYLVAIMDLYSRYVLSWRLSNALDADFCVEALGEALKYGKPVIFNSDQGSQFTSESFTGCLIRNMVSISMDSCGRAYDNIFVERLWRTVKYEDIYIKGYETIFQAKDGLGKYFHFYNTERPHQALGYKTPWEVYSGIGNMPIATEIVRPGANKEVVLAEKQVLSV